MPTRLADMPATDHSGYAGSRTRSIFMVLLVEGTEIGPAAQVRSTPVPAGAYAFTSKGSTRARTRNVSGEAGPMSRRLTHKMSLIASQPEFNLFMFGVLLTMHGS